MDGGNIYGELKAPETSSFGKTISVRMLGSSFSLSPGDIDINIHFPKVVSVGLPFCYSRIERSEFISSGRV